jgi:hypothetical protein
MWLKITRGCTDLGFGYMAGPSGRDIPDEIAEILLANNRAVVIPPPKKEKVKEVEPVVKTTIQPQARTRPVKKSTKRPVKKGWSIR